MGVSRLTRAILPGIVSAVVITSGFGRTMCGTDSFLFFPRLLLGSVAEEDENEEIHYDLKIFELFKSLFS